MKPIYEKVIVQQSSDPDHAVGVLFVQRVGDSPATHWHHLNEHEAENFISALQSALEAYRLGHTWYVSEKEE